MRRNHRKWRTFRKNEKHSENFKAQGVLRKAHSALRTTQPENAKKVRPEGVGTTKLSCKLTKMGWEPTKLGWKTPKMGWKYPQSQAGCPPFLPPRCLNPSGKPPGPRKFYIPAPLCETWGKFTAKSLIQWGSKNPYRCFHKSSKQAPFSPCGPRARQAAVRRPRAGPFGNSLHVQRLTLGKSPTNPAEKVTPGPHLTAPRCSTR